MNGRQPPAAILWRRLGAGPWSAATATWRAMGEDNIGLIAAGAAFYAFSSIAPVLAACVLSYGLIASPETVQAHIRALFAALPADVAGLIGGQLDTVSSGSAGKKGLGLFVALALALYGGSKAASSMMTALNIALQLPERRGFVRGNLAALGIVAGGVLLMLAGIGASTATAFLSSLLPHAPGVVLTAIGLSGYALMALIAVTGASALFRFGPSRGGSLRRDPMRWGTPGAVLATALWLAATMGFGQYVAHFGNYGATYGALSSIVVVLTWLWLSIYAFLLGAELDRALGGAAAAVTEEEEVPASAVAAPPQRSAAVSAGLTMLGLLLLLRRRR